MLTRWLAGLLLLYLTGVTTVFADRMLKLDSGEQRVQLLELFTSQGCSSCPPAEAWLNSFTSDDRLWKQVVPVAFHVDYWDYLGWRDPFASKEYSSRQASYRTHGKVSSVYTPGFVLNGKEWRGWFSRDSLPEQAEKTGRLTAVLQGERLRVTYSASAAVLHVAVLGFGIRQPVAAGENAGKTLPQEFVVLGYERYSSENSDWQVELPKIKTGNAERQALAIWVTGHNAVEPLQATGGWL